MWQMRVFLARSFHTEDRRLVELVDRLLHSHNLHVVSGRRLGGQQPNPAVFQRIDEADALVALLTRRAGTGRAAEGLDQTHQWVRDEYSYARLQRKQAIALVEIGVGMEGAFVGDEKIPLDRENPVEAMVALSETIREWKGTVGEHRLVKLLPVDRLAQHNWDDPDVKCRYRLISRGHCGDWVDCRPVVQAGGPVLYVTGVRDDDTMVEVRVWHRDDVQWTSHATAQLVSVEMRPS